MTPEERKQAEQQAELEEKRLYQNKLLLAYTRKLLRNFIKEVNRIIKDTDDLLKLDK